MSVVAYLRGEYGFRDIFMGVPAVIDSTGVRKIIEDENLGEKTREDLRRSAQIVEKNTSIVREIPETCRGLLGASGRGAPRRRCFFPFRRQPGSPR